MPFVTGTREVNAFQLNTPIIAGKPFFAYTKHYYNILKDIQDNSQYEGFYIKGNQFDVKAIITKDSGVEGGVLEKLHAARECGIKIIVIEKTKFTYDIEFNDPENLVKYLKKLSDM